MNNNDIENQFLNISKQLLSMRNKQGFWEGRLSSSALAAAVSIVALYLYDKEKYQSQIDAGLNWLKSNINTDGSYGDTPESEGNVSTSLLCFAAFSLLLPPGDKHILSVTKFLESKNLKLNADEIIRSLLLFYGKDYSFAVPIMAMLGICGIIGNKDIRKIPQLPFELALFPDKFYRFLNLQVVSYAIPALTAVGIYTFKQKKGKNIIRKKAINPVLRKLEKTLPESGGFLEAVPLTAFVAMCLIKSDFKKINLITKAINFLVTLQRPDGSWPIDTNLSTWVTSQSIRALGSQIHSLTDTDDINRLLNYYQSTQYKTVHPFNRAAPGGWGWTAFAGSVPDADDTSGAVIACLILSPHSDECFQSLSEACTWLAGLQNSDGGIPTFCKGWGRLPFDSSCPDISGHAFAAVAHFVYRFRSKLSDDNLKFFTKMLSKIIRYLKKKQSGDGLWYPLWFGNQQAPGKRNPVYGTAKISIYLNESLPYLTEMPDLKNEVIDMLKNAQTYLLQCRNENGSWGADKNVPGTIEETSLAVAASAHLPDFDYTLSLQWLQTATTNGIKSSPIGLYFALLWYDEQLYPWAFYTEALRGLVDISYSKQR